MFKTTVTTAVAAAAILASHAAFAGANLVANGGFETPSIATFYVNYTAGSPAPGWAVTTNNVDIVNGQFTPSGPAPAYEGQQYLDLVGYGATGAIPQSISTVAGKTYHFSFAYSNNPWSTSTASADYAFGGATGSVTHSGANTTDLLWTTLAGSFTATSASTLVSFNETVGGNNGGVLLDAVTVSAPEASTWTMMLAGFAGLAVLAYRRSSQVIALP
jgi:hypothetical protein